MPSLRAVLIGALALAAGACAPEGRAAFDLVRSFAEAELRADDLDLTALAADPALEQARGAAGPAHGLGPGAPLAAAPALPVHGG